MSTPSSAASRPVRTRFAPSPTGFIHLGNIRSALYPWAFARKHGGVFILRIEDTDTERSSEEAVQVIVEGMQWLGLDYDEGPYFQMQRMDRYRAVIAQMLADGQAYHCYCTPEELDAMREAQRERGDKPRYDGRWRPAPGKELPAPPAGVQPVVRFMNPLDGVVAWDDAVKGRIEIANAELDDLIIARSDGTPTYNFCVVIDDLDMRITHVIRGDDHVNNTPRQINILQALGAELPVYAHLPTILNEQGEKLSKRHGAISVRQYQEDGYLPDAMVNYLARLGWAHGDEEIFSREQFVGWFDLEHLSRSAAQFDSKKLRWLNNHYIKQAADDWLADQIAPRIAALGVTVQGAPLAAVAGLLKDRSETLQQLAEAALLFYRPHAVDAELKAQHLTAAALPVLQAFLEEGAMVEWERHAIGAWLKLLLQRFGLKMPQLAIPLRVALVGQTQTPSIDAVLELFGREEALHRVRAALLPHS
jgi:glutamyl-tRNA synthetase